MEETLRRLEEEHRKAAADVQAGEGERAQAQAALAQAKRALQSLQKRHGDEEARGRALQHELLQQNCSSELRRQTIAGVSAGLAEEEAVRAAWGDADATAASLDSVARMRMASYEMVQQECLSKDRLHQQVMHARARVAALKSRLQAFRHSPGSVEPLRSQIRHLEEAVLALRRQSGSSSWRTLKKRLQARRTVSRRSLTALSVRHPLARLKSAYRDKFLDGNPVSKYDSAWRAETQSHQSWRYRWEAYWLPALISRGDIQPSPWLRDRQKKMQTVSNPCMQTLFSIHGIANKMGLEYRSQMDTYVKRFMKASFSFEDFLHHILWCRDHGVLDHHWAPQSCLCNVCKKQYDFILHTESVTQESKHALAVAGIAPNLYINTQHSTKSVTKNSGASYFDRVNNDTLWAILQLYKNDFDLFGYEL